MRHFGRASGLKYWLLILWLRHGIISWVSFYQCEFSLLVTSVFRANVGATLRDQETFWLSSFTPEAQVKSNIRSPHVPHLARTKQSVHFQILDSGGHEWLSSVGLLPSCLPSRWCSTPPLRRTGRTRLTASASTRSMMWLLFQLLKTCFHFHPVFC